MKGCSKLKISKYFVHEGYYFPENHFAVKGRKQEFLYRGVSSMSKGFHWRYVEEA